MKRTLLLSLLLMLLPLRLYAQTPPRSSLSGYCEQGGQKVTLAGMQSTSKVQASYPDCTISVFISNSSGVQSGTYTSGGSATGAPGDTCTVTFIGGGGLGATATVPLSAINTLSSGTAFTILTNGVNYTSTPTSATLTSGIFGSFTATSWSLLCFMQVVYDSLPSSARLLPYACLQKGREP